MSRVVDDDVDHVGGLVRTDDRHGTHVHEGSAVTVDAPYLELGSVKSNAERDAGAVTHRTYGKEVIFVAHAFCGTVFKELSGDLARRGYDGIFSCGFCDLSYHILAVKRELVLIIDLAVKFESALANYECDLLAVCKKSVELIDDLGKLFLSGPITKFATSMSSRSLVVTIP